ncbi:DUF1127 domain-containing protein [Sodalis sp. C49]|uniref:DUF1127 domain-containing protein n=1 Tax=unclassified Sodalis (in: enterobacteria) TaxID=2636512 RepID=UPI0039659F88
MKNLITADPDNAPERIACGNTGWWRRLYGRYQQWRRHSRSRKALRSLNDAQLRDIGLTRDDLPYKDERGPSAQ